MAAAITAVKKRESESPGIFQYIADEMLKANKILLVKFPVIVISGYRQRQEEAAEDVPKKKTIKKIAGKDKGHQLIADSWKKIMKRRKRWMNMR